MRLAPQDKMEYNQSDMNGWTLRSSTVCILARLQMQQLVLSVGYLPKRSIPPIQRTAALDKLVADRSVACTDGIFLSTFLQPVVKFSWFLPDLRSGTSVLRSTAWLWDPPPIRGYPSSKCVFVYNNQPFASCFTYFMFYLTSRYEYQLKICQIGLGFRCEKHFEVTTSGYAI